MSDIVQCVVIQLALVSEFVATAQTQDWGLAVVHLGIRKVRIAFLGGEEGGNCRTAPEPPLDSLTHVEARFPVHLSALCTEHHSFRAGFAEDSLRGRPRCDENPGLVFLFALL